MQRSTYRCSNASFDSLGSHYIFREVILSKGKQFNTEVKFCNENCLCYEIKVITDLYWLTHEELNSAKLRKILQNNVEPNRKRLMDNTYLLINERLDEHKSSGIQPSMETIDRHDPRNQKKIAGILTSLDIFTSRTRRMLKKGFSPKQLDIFDELFIEEKYTAPIVKIEAELDQIMASTAIVETPAGDLVWDPRLDEDMDQLKYWDNPEEYQVVRTRLIYHSRKNFTSIWIHYGIWREIPMPIIKTERLRRRLSVKLSSRPLTSRGIQMNRQDLTKPTHQYEVYGHRNVNVKSCLVKPP
jgi:hypothetical protein